MLGWFAQSIGHALLGLGLLAGAVIGGLVILPKTIYEGSNHDWHRCRCYDCTKRRDNAYRRIKHEKNQGQDFIPAHQLEDFPEHTRNYLLKNPYRNSRDNLHRRGEPRRRGWITTRELTTGMRVETAKGYQYQVTNMENVTGGIEVHLSNLHNNRPARVVVSNIDARYWKPIASWRN